jgi:CRISPR-associated endoribonuclease Cas6
MFQVFSILDMTRLIIGLRSTRDQQYQMQYHRPLQGFVYSLMNGHSKYGQIHNDNNSHNGEITKTIPFCFSNIFPPTYMRRYDTRTFIISSPDKQFIEYLHGLLSQPWNRSSANKIRIGLMEFTIEYVSIYDLKIPADNCQPFSLITGTPIVVRIYRDRYLEYGFKVNGEYDCVYWRSNHPLSLFLNQMQNLLVSKCGGNGDNNGIEIFQKLKFKKQISTRISMKGT